MDEKAAQVLESAQHEEVEQKNVCNNVAHEELLAKLEKSEYANRAARIALRSMREKLNYYQQQYETFDQKIQECVQTNEIKKKALLGIMSTGAKAYRKLEQENEDLKRQLNEYAKNEKLEQELQQLKFRLQAQDRKIEELESVAISKKKPGMFSRVRQWFGARHGSSTNTSST